MKAWALMLVVALGVFGMALPAGAAKVTLTDMELDDVGAGDSAAAASQVGLGSARAASASNGIDGPTSTTANVVVDTPTTAAAAAAGNHPGVAATAGNDLGTAGAQAGSNTPGFGNGKTLFSKLKAVWTFGATQIGVQKGVCKGICP